MKLNSFCVLMGVLLTFGCSHFSDQSSKGSDGAGLEQEIAVEQEAVVRRVPAKIQALPQFEMPSAAAQEQREAPLMDLTDAEPEHEATETAGDSPEAGHAAARHTSKRIKSQQMMDEALDFCDVAQSFWQNGELDNSLEALDKAYSLILDVDTAEEEKLFQQKEDLRFLISKRILEIYASRNIVVNGEHDEIPLEMNDHIQAELLRFTTGAERNFFQQAYQRSGLYRPYIVQALKNAGLPEELSWLPLIESGFKTKALSRARALGLWQFIPSTGYKFGLKRDRYIDERMDFVKSTQAAIAYLQELHNIFGDWATVLAAYNCGEGRVLRVIRTQNINYLDNFWDLYAKLPSETARYVPRFFATLHIVKNLERYGYQDLETDLDLVFDMMPIERELQLKDIAAAVNLDLDELKLLNPELRYHIIPPDGYDLRIPRGHSQVGMAEKLAAIPTAKIVVPQQQTYVWHTVKSGDTLSNIARRYRSSVQKIMQANNLRNSHFIGVGKRLKIPGSGYVAAQNDEETPSAIPESRIHRVRSGDSLWKIAQSYGLTVQRIQSINGLSSSTLYVGQQLIVSGSSVSKPESAKIKNYQVRQGDTPYTIALRHNMPLDRLLTLNQLTPRSKIFPGQQLSIE